MFVFMKTMQIHKSQKMLFIVHKCFLPNYVQSHNTSKGQDAARLLSITAVTHLGNVFQAADLTMTYRE